MFLYQIQESLDAIARDAQLEQARRNVMAQIHASCEWDAAIAHETMKHRVLSAHRANPEEVEHVVTGLGGWPERVHAITRGGAYYFYQCIDVDTL